MRCIQRLISVCVLSIFIACDNPTHTVDIIHINTKPISLNSYFQLDSSEFNNDSYHSFYQINKILNLDNIIDTGVDLEIRILTTKYFDTTYLYRLKLQQDTLWTGEVYALQYLTQKLIEKKSFIPINGWHEFQSAVLTYDLLNCDINKIKIPDSCYFIHPRQFSFQIISPRNMKIVSFGSFYDYLYTCNIKQQEFDQMTQIMNSLFDKNKRW